MCVKDCQWESWKPVLKWTSVLCSLIMIVMNVIMILGGVIFTSPLIAIYSIYSIVFGLWIMGVEMRLSIMANRFRFIEGPRLFGRAAFYIFIATLQISTGSAGVGVLGPIAGGLIGCCGIAYLIAGCACGGTLEPITPKTNAERAVEAARSNPKMAGKMAKAAIKA